MNKPEKITGEWIKAEIHSAMAEFKARNSTTNPYNNFNTFQFHVESKQLTDTIKELRSICPHEYKDEHCIYCGEEQRGDTNE